MSVPNIISLARLLAVPVAIYFILAGLYGPAFWLFVAAGVSDALDGFLAKRLNQASTLGGYLDPMADKALLVGVYLTLGYVGELPNWLVILVVFRDIIIVGGVVMLHLTSQNVRMKPLIISKINTGAQIALVAVVLGELGLGTELGMLRDGLILLVALTTLASGAGYLGRWFRQEARAHEGPP